MEFNCTEIHWGYHYNKKDSYPSSFHQNYNKKLHTSYCNFGGNFGEKDKNKNWKIKMEIMGCVHRSAQPNNKGQEPLGEMGTNAN